MRGLAIFLVVALLIVGGLYATGALNGTMWRRSGEGTGTTAGTVITENRTVGPEGAQSAQVELKMGAGRVTLQGGASGLMDAAFSYNVTDWKPIVDYVVRDGEGHLTVRQPSGTSTTLGTGYRNDWNIRLGSTIPIDLAFKTGAGETDMDLTGTMVRSLTVDSGASSTKVKASPGAMTSLDVNAGVGEVVLDLSGDWKHSADINVDGGVGSIRLTVPRDVGVVVAAKRGIGSISASGFTRDGNTYRNASAGRTAVTLNISLNVGVGSVSITQR
jgi:hypothetical protein